MDYRQLLDPKGPAKAKSKNGIRAHGPQQSRKLAAPPPAPPQPSPVKFDPRLLLNPKAAAAKSTAPSTASEDIADNKSSTIMESENTDRPIGMTELIIRQNNVTNREAPPPRKRKAEEVDQDDANDGEQQKPKSTFTGVTSGGELGVFMRAEREKGAAESGPSTQTIDLTNDTDDDEVHILGSQSKPKPSEDNREVCLGRINPQAWAFRIPAIPRYQTQTAKMGNGFWPSLRVMIKRLPAQDSIIELYVRASSESKTGIRFAKLDGKLAAVLCPLLDNNVVTKMRLKVYLDMFPKRPGEYAGCTVSRSIPLSMMIMAPRNKADPIGQMLSRAGFFLGPPFNLDPGVEFYNPQLPKDYRPIGATARQIPQSSRPPIQRTQEAIMRDTASMFDSLVKTEQLPEMEANTNLILTPLMSHQKQALHFLTEHERGDQATTGDADFSLWKRDFKKNGDVWYNVITGHELPQKPSPAQGGILADVMGLGKTLSILALITHTLAEAEEFGKAEAPLEETQLQRNSKATLIVCPKSVMTNWTEQVKLHTKKGTFKVYSYHGVTRTQDVDELAEHDLVLAPYQTVASDFSDTTGKRTALASINWFRVVLDEAHQIRNPSTHVSKACCKLPAQRRWAVTGTPVQNRLDDLGALIKFLRIKPFDEPINWSQYIIAPFRSASEHVLQHLRLLVDSITLRRLKDNIDLTKRFEERIRLDFSDDEMAIYSQFSKASNMQLRIMLKDGNRLKGKSYAHVLKALGRLRAICAHGREMLNEEDLKELEGLTAGTAIELGDEPDDEPDGTFISEKNAYDTFQMMNESEVDICTGCSRKIGGRKDDGDADAAETQSDSEQEDDETPAESSSDVENNTMGYLTPCFHLLCPKCKDTYVDDTRPTLTDDHYHTCPYCEQYVRWGLFELTHQGLKNLLDARSNKNKKGAKWDESTYSGPHTKVSALLEDLEKSRQETLALPSDEPPIRSVVFSGWTTYLDLIEHALDSHQINSVRLDGSLSLKSRSAVLKTFATDPTVTVLLVSIKAGGQGLNFTSANKVYMMEPQFNPGVENQAIDRVHRLGQKRDVRIVHYIVKESVEEKILQLQEKKEKLAALSLEKKMSRSDEAKKRIEELRDLFK